MRGLTKPITIMKSLHAFLSFLIGVILFAGITLAVPIRVDAQNTQSLVEYPGIELESLLVEMTLEEPIYANVQVTPFLMDGFRTGLRSNSPMHRHLALLDVGALANASSQVYRMGLHTAENRQFQFVNNAEVLTGEIMDLTPLVSDLVANYYRGPEDYHRLLALYALTGIGADDALTTILEDGGAGSHEVKRITQRHLSRYYLEKYPELVNRTRMTRTFSLQDVERVKRSRAKTAAKALERG
jgi:hypothetical protein